MNINQEIKEPGRNNMDKIATEVINDYIRNGLTASKTRGMKSQGKEMLSEIETLIQFDTAREIFAEALNKAREKVREFNRTEYADEIPSMLKDLSQSKSFFFQFNRLPDSVDSSGKYKWQIENFKLADKKDLVNHIFSDFLGKIDEYPVDPGQIQLHPGGISLLDKTFEIQFMKTSEDRVRGFVKEIEKEKDDDFVIVNNEKLLMLDNRGFKAGKEELYARIFQLLEEHPEQLEDVFFSILMLLNRRTHVSSLRREI